MRAPNSNAAHITPTGFERLVQPIHEAGQCLLLFFRMLAGVRAEASQWRAILQQVYLVGTRSLVIIIISGFFVGMVLSLQAVNALEQFGAPRAGQRGQPRPRPPYPAESGLWGCPTLINNVETFANVNPITDVDRDNRLVSINFFVDPGKRVYIRRIQFVGNAGTKDEVLRREMRQMESGWLSNTAVERSQQLLRRLHRRPHRQHRCRRCHRRPRIG